MRQAPSVSRNLPPRYTTSITIPLEPAFMARLRQQADLDGIALTVWVRRELTSVVEQLEEHQVATAQVPSNA